MARHQHNGNQTGQSKAEVTCQVLAVRGIQITRKHQISSVREAVSRSPVSWGTTKQPSIKGQTFSPSLLCCCRKSRPPLSARQTEVPSRRGHHPCQHCCGCMPRGGTGGWHDPSAGHLRTAWHERCLPCARAAQQGGSRRARQPLNALETRRQPRSQTQGKNRTQTCRAGDLSSTPKSKLLAKLWLSMTFYLNGYVSRRWLKCQGELSEAQGYSPAGRRACSNRWPGSAATVLDAGSYPWCAPCHSASEPCSYCVRAGTLGSSSFQTESETIPWD